MSLDGFGNGVNLLMVSYSWVEIFTNPSGIIEISPICERGAGAEHNRTCRRSAFSEICAGHRGKFARVRRGVGPGTGQFWIELIEFTAETKGWSAAIRQKRRACTSCTPFSVKFSAVLRMEAVNR
eukprot:1798967-Prymnesium_polylepis.1